MCAPSSLTDDLIENDPKPETGGGDNEGVIPPGQDPWQWWNTLRRVCHHHKRLGVGEEHL